MISLCWIEHDSFSGEGYTQKGDRLNESSVRSDDKIIKAVDTYLYRAPNARTIALTMVLAFVLPVVIMALALLKVQIWPGGKFTLYIYDMQGFFNPLISSLRYLGNGDSSFFYSFFGALGNNAFLNYIGYAQDPTNWITLLFPLEQMPTAIYFITLFKIGMCGLGASTYFFFGIKEKKYPCVILILSVCYALMSYNVMYSQCIMWFNVTALAPAILLGIEKIIDGRRGGIYVLCMTLALYYNSQMAYMTGIFSILYLFFRLSETANKRKSIVARFVICNILCVGLYMPCALSVMYNILNGRLKMGNPMAGRFFYYPVWEVAKQFISCQYSTIETEGLPSLFCGTFVPFIAVISLILPLKSAKTRFIMAGIYIMFLASFCIVPLNQFWHGFNEPNSFPGRYSFLFCLYLIILVYYAACYAYEKMKLSSSILYLLYGLAGAVTCIELYLNAGYILTELNIEYNYSIDADYQLQLLYTTDALKQIDDSGFYRIGKDLPYSLNDGMIYGYNGISYFATMFERKTMDFIGMLGYSQSEHALTGSGGTPLSESLLGIKYKLVRMPELFGYYTSIYTNGLYDLQYNENALPIGFILKYKKYDPNTDPELVEGADNHNSLVYQQYILSELCGERVYAFDNIKYSLEEVETDEFARYIKMKFIATSDKPIWIYCRYDHNGRTVQAPNRKKDDSKTIESYSSSTYEQLGSAILKVNGSERYPFVDQVSTMCIYLGSFKAGEEIEVEAACVNEFDDPWIAYYNSEECEEALKDIKEMGFEVTEHNNGIIKGRINVQSENDLLVMTLPYMRGYRIKVDGKKTDYGHYREALLAIKIPPGEHTVEIYFIPPGLILGSIIGILFIAITFTYLRTPCKRVCQNEYDELS